MRVLIVEDNLLTARGLEFLLEHEGFEVEVAGSAASTSSSFSERRFDLILLDINLPDKDGITLAREIRENTGNVPIIFLTAKDDEESIINAFDLNADDYITKPFRNRELISRINATLRRHKSKVGEITCGELVLNEDNFSLSRGGTRINLSALEYKIIRLLMLNSGQIVTRERLLDEIWDASGNIVNDNTLTVYIKRLREKLGGEETIKTVKGLGYKMEET